MPDAQLTLFAHPEPEHPREGGLVAVYPGSSKTLKPILAIAHIDVVEAKREDWAAIRSRSSRRTAISTVAGQLTTRRWQRCWSIP